MEGYKANNSLVNRVNTYIRNITNDPTRINPTVSIENPEMNYHLTLSNNVKLGLVTLITAATFLTGCFTVPVENYGPTKPILDSPANKQVFTTEKDKKKIDLKWKESVIYQILEDKDLKEGETKDIEYTLRIDNDKDMSSPEHEVKTSDLEAAVEVAKGVNYWQVGAKIVTENGEKCFYLEPEQNYSDEEVLSEIREFDIKKIVIPPPVTDTDGDGIEDSVDNCPNTYNPNQLDTDGDGLGDLCDSFPYDPDNDVDGDGIGSDTDNCPNTYNPDQLDTDGDGIGDVCDSDIDGDGVPNSVDNCVYEPNPGQEDWDNDGIGTACDDDEQPPPPF